MAKRKLNLSTILTEDQVRDKARETLGLYNTDSAISDVGQLTSFNQLGFDGIKDRPDGWYLPKDNHFPAIIVEVKNSNISLGISQINEVLKNSIIVSSKYTKVIAILYNGFELKVYKNGKLLEDEIELRNKEYYFGLFSENHINRGLIYSVTKRINDSLHTDFGIKNLYHRMIFTACALVAKKYDAFLEKGMSFNTFSNSIIDKLSKSYSEALRKNAKLSLLLDVYSEIKMNSTENQVAIDNFISDITLISNNLNSDFWNGEDVMAIFFNEFNRYKKKTESGQVFTPDHITSLMYRILDVSASDFVLDAACGSGAFLVKSMCNMIKEVGGARAKQSDLIKQSHLFGIEFDREIFALACANMLIHKDGKTNLEQLDSRSNEACAWIKSKPITKVLMNPPFEDKYGCLQIVKNVLDNVAINTLCAFILPDTKLEKKKGFAIRLLKEHRLEKIIKLPIKVFTGATTSIFIFRANIPQKEHDIFSCYISDDGHETVKNQGRQDIYNKWKEIEDYWVSVINRQSGDSSIQWLNPKDQLAYRLPEQPLHISETDFKKNIVDFILFENQTDSKDYHLVIDRLKD